MNVHREDESLVRNRVMAPVRSKMASIFADRLGIRKEMAQVEVGRHSLLMNHVTHCDSRVPLRKQRPPRRAFSVILAA